MALPLFIDRLPEEMQTIEFAVFAGIILAAGAGYMIASGNFDDWGFPIKMIVLLLVGTVLPAIYIFGGFVMPTAP